MVDKIIQNFLSNLGLSGDEIKTYSSLLEKGNQTILELARHTGIARTNVYRLLEEMKEKGVVEEIIDDYKTKAKAASADTLELLISRKENQAKNLRAQLPSVSETISHLTLSTPADTKVLFYRGKNGIEQMFWNALRAKEEIVGYTYRTSESIIGTKAIIRWTEEFQLRHLKLRDLYSDELIKSKKDPTKPEPGDWTNNESRYIKPEILNIIHQMDIYNDVVGIYNWQAEEIFGVEIHNAKVAQMQKQIFEVFCNLAKSHSA